MTTLKKATKGDIKINKTKAPQIKKKQNAPTKKQAGVTKKIVKTTEPTKEIIAKSTKSLKRKTEDTELDNTNKPTKQKKIELVPESTTHQISVIHPSETVQKIGDYYAIPYKFTEEGALRHLLVKHDPVKNVLRITNKSIGLQEDALKQMFEFFEPNTLNANPMSMIGAAPEIEMDINKQDADMDEFVESLDVPVILDENKVPTLDTIVTKRAVVSAKQMMKDVDDFMFKYDKNTAAKEVGGKFQRPVLARDSEGFKVARGRINLAGGDHIARKEKSIEMLQKKEKAKQLTNFYKFQRAEQVQAQQAEQNKKMANDRKRIELMVKQQKFKALSRS